MLRNRNFEGRSIWAVRFRVEPVVETWSVGFTNLSRLYRYWLCCIARSTRLLPLSCTPSSEYSPTIITLCPSEAKANVLIYLVLVLHLLGWSLIRQFLVLGCSLPDKKLVGCIWIAKRKMFTLSSGTNLPLSNLHNSRALQWIPKVQVWWSHHLHWYWRSESTLADFNQCL